MRVGTKSSMTVALMRRGKSRHTGRTPCAVEAEIRSEAPANQQTPKIPRSHKKLEEAGKESLLDPSGECDHADSVISDFWPPEL